MKLHPALNEEQIAEREAQRAAAREAHSAEKARKALLRAAMAPAARETIVPVPFARVCPRTVRNPWQDVPIQPVPPPPPRPVVWQIRWDDPLLIAIAAIAVVAAGYAWAAIRLAP
jgi:hypothetical protein